MNNTISFFAAALANTQQHQAQIHSNHAAESVEQLQVQLPQHNMGEDELNNAAEFFKKAFLNLDKAKEGISALARMEEEEHSSQLLETPHFGEPIQGSLDALTHQVRENTVVVANEVLGSQQPTENAEQGQLRNNEQAIQNVNMPSNFDQLLLTQPPVNTANQNAPAPPAPPAPDAQQPSNIEKIEVAPQQQKRGAVKPRRFPLYGMDHSRQFFENHQSLCLRLKQYQDFVRLFCSSGIANLQQGIQLNEQTWLSGEQLSELSAQVFHTVLRRLQQYLSKTCGNHIVRVEEGDVSYLCGLMFDCGTVLGEERLGILHKIMKLSYDLPARINKEDAQQFYAMLMMALSIRKEEEEDEINYGSVAGGRFAWDIRSQQLFCRAYLKTKSLGLAGEEMGRLGVRVGVVELKVKLEELLRRAVRKMDKYYREYDPQWACPLLLGRREIQLIARERKGQAARLSLIQILLNKAVYLQDMRKAVDAIAAALREKGEQNKTETKPVQRRQKQKVSSSESVYSSNHQKQQQEEEESQEYYRPKQTKSTRKVNGSSRAPTKQQTLMEVYQQRGPVVKVLKKLGTNEVLASKTRGQGVGGVARRGRPASGFSQRTK